MTARKGTMLLEVIVALAIASMVLVAGGMALRAVAIANAASARRAAAQTHTRNAEMLVRTLVRLVVPPDSTSLVYGARTALRFATRCMTANGWTEPCLASIQSTASDSDHAAGAFRIEHGSAETVYLGAGVGTIRYLVDARHGGVWLDVWPDSTRIPIAIGLETAGQSLLVPMGHTIP